MVDFAAGHITSEQSHPIIAALDDAARRRARRRAVPRRRRVPPPVRRAARSGRRRVRPAARPHRPGRGPARPVRPRRSCIALMDAVAAGRPPTRPAVSVRSPPRSGSGVRAPVPQLPPFADAQRRRRPAHLGGRPRARAGRAVGHRGGRRRRAPPRASTTTTPRQRDAALASLRDRDFFLLHVEATDEAGHQGAIDEKVTSLERWDAEIIGPLVDALGDTPFRILLMPDHATPCATQTHTSEPVPYLLFDSTAPGSRRCLHGARGGRAGTPVPGHSLMESPHRDSISAIGRGRVVARAAREEVLCRVAAGRFGAQSWANFPVSGVPYPRKHPLSLEV